MDGQYYEGDLPAAAYGVYCDPIEPTPTNTELNTLPKGWTLEEATQYGNILGRTGEFLTAEQVAKIEKAFSGLLPARQNRAIEITAAWLHTHHGFGLPNLDGILQIEQQEFNSRP